MESKRKVILKALKVAFPLTLPVMAGYAFLGLSYGVYSSLAGLSPLYPFILAICIFGGSMQFASVAMLLSTFAPLETLVITIAINIRYLFYGIPMIDKYKNAKWKKPFLIHELTDETFSITYANDPPSGVDAKWFYFFISFLDHIYWIVAATLGGVLGSVLNISIKGVEFVLVALFVCIFIDQLRKDKNPGPEIIGLVGSIACLSIFGKDNFLIPTMIFIVACLSIFMIPFERWHQKNDHR